jgi:hypothetical protein
MPAQNSTSLAGIYVTRGVNQTLDISEEEVELTHDNTHSRGKARVVFDFIPRPSLKFDIEFDKSVFNIAHVFSPAVAGKIEFLQRGLLYDVHLINKFMSTQAPFRIIAAPTQEPIALKISETVKEVVFHVVNFFDLWADHFIFNAADGGMIKGNRLSLNDGKFNIVIESLPQTSESIKELNEQGGYAITHVGAIRRKDGKSFKIDAANELLDHLLWFLSFARGTWAPPVFPVGFDLQSKKVWEKWGCVHVHPWRTVLSWFDYHHGNCLAPLFESFVNKVRDPLWGESIKAAIYWYVYANTQGAGADGAIILTQAALERLSWAYHVNTSKSLSADGFSKLQASDQLRLFLSHAHIPISVPAQLEELSAFAREFNFDGPEAFTYVRNRLVHPLVKGKKKDYESPVLRQCWFLGLWYLELVLLHCFDYNDVYGNRLIPGRIVGQTEPVPWKTT